MGLTVLEQDELPRHLGMKRFEGSSVHIVRTFSALLVSTTSDTSATEIIAYAFCN